MIDYGKKIKEMNYSSNRIPKYLKNFEYVMTVEQSGGITQAAEVLHIAQPALSRYIRRIEEDLGLELFDRTSLPIRVTEAGAYYIEAGQKMLETARQMERKMDEIRQTGNISLKIGISPSRTAYLLPDILAEFRKETGYSVGIEIIEKGIDELRTLLQTGSLDMIFSFDSAVSDETCCISLYEEKMLFAVPETASTEAKAKELLQNGTLITLPENTRTGRMTGRILKELGIEPKEKINCVIAESALAMVRTGLGVSFVPSYIARSHWADGIRFFDLGVLGRVEDETENFCLLHRKNQYLTQTERIFAECTRKVSRERKLP